MKLASVICVGSFVVVNDSLTGGCDVGVVTNVVLSQDFFASRVLSEDVEDNHIGQIIRLASMREFSYIFMQSLS